MFQSETMGTAQGWSLMKGLNWVPRSHLKKAIFGLIILIVFLGSILNFEVIYYTEKNRLDLEVNDLKMITVGPWSSLEPANHKYGIYMYLGCTVSSFASVFWHVTQAVKVCDLSSPGPCDVKMKRDYTFDELALKAQEWLQSDRFADMLNQNEVIVKLDDDTIISKEILDGLVDSFVKSDCKLAAVMHLRQEDGLFWGDGPLYLVKAEYLKQQLRDNGNELQRHRTYEDVQMSSMLNLRDRESVCNIDINKFKHRYYQDSRMTIRYKPYVKC